MLEREPGEVPERADWGDDPGAALKPGLDSGDSLQGAYGLDKQPDVG